jgi:hypothetical protein
MNIKIRHETRIYSQEEIDDLLLPVDKTPFYKRIIRFYKRICEWKLIISFNGIEYKLGLNGIRREDYSVYYKEHLKKTNSTDIIKFDETDAFSQEEKEMLLTPINHKKEGNGTVIL